MAKKSKRLTIPDIVAKKATSEKVVAITAYDYPFAKIVDKAGVDIILVGDSLANAVQGRKNTLRVTLDESIYHTTLVARGARTAVVIGDMPFLTYQASNEQAVLNAGRYLKETAALGVKVEGGVRSAERIRAIVEAQIPVMGHVGMTPQSVHVYGGCKVQREREGIIEDALAVENAGAFSVVLESIPAEIAAEITAKLKIPTIGIGAGVACDGQIIVLHDIIGIDCGYSPKFVKRYANVSEIVTSAVADFAREVREESFPGEEHTYK